MRISHRTIFYQQPQLFRPALQFLLRRSYCELGPRYPVHMLIKHYGQCLAVRKLPSVSWEYVFERITRTLQQIDLSEVDPRANSAKEKVPFQHTLSGHHLSVLNYAKHGLARRLIDNGKLDQAQISCEELRYSFVPDLENERIRAWATHDLAWIAMQKGEIVKAKYFYQDALW